MDNLKLLPYWKDTETDNKLIDPISRLLNLRFARNGAI